MGNGLRKSVLMRVSEAAKLLHVSPATVRNYCNAGLIETQRTPYGHRVITQEAIDAFLGKTTKRITAFYLRSSSGDKTLLQKQKEELTQAYGEPDYTYRDSASGLNEQRKGLQQLLTAAKKGKYNTLCITYQDRLTRFGYHYLQQLLQEYGVQILVLHENIKYSIEEELMKDFMSLIASFSGRFYRIRGKQQQKQLLHDAEEQLS
jgi:putative resolvase